MHFPNYSEDQLVKASNLQLTKLSVKNMDLSAVPVQTLAKEAVTQGCIIKPPIPPLPIPPSILAKL